MCATCCDRTYEDLAESVAGRFADAPAASVAAQLIQNQLWTSHAPGTGAPLGVRVARRLAPRAPWALDQPLAAAAALLAERGTPDVLTVFGPESRVRHKRKPVASARGWLIRVTGGGEWAGNFYAFLIGERGAVYTLETLNVGLDAEKRLIPYFDSAAARLATALGAEPTNFTVPLSTEDDAAAAAALARAGY